MRTTHLLPLLRQIAQIIAVLAVFVAPGCLGNLFPRQNDEAIYPLELHPLLPEGARSETQIAAGAVTGEAPLQPIAFPHNRHVQLDGIDCQYCHSAARNSIHAGVPEIATCMGCHRFVLKNSPEIKLLTRYWERGEAVPWKKVHDLPDFVTFSHMRHVRAGVNCTECHGQVQTMAGARKAPVKAEGGAEGEAPAEAAAEPTTAAEAAEILGPAEHTMTREATLQMGWCLDCHATHESINTNYGDLADLRRAELKDCWTCHK
jgi:hypothetical protein